MGAVELDLISRLEASQEVSGPGDAWAPKAGASGECRGVERCSKQRLAAAGSPSPRVPSSSLEDVPQGKAAGGACAANRSRGGAVPGSTREYCGGASCPSSSSSSRS